MLNKYEHSQKLMIKVHIPTPTSLGLGVEPTHDGINYTTPYAENPCKQRFLCVLQASIYKLTKLSKSNRKADKLNNDNDGPP